MNTFQRHPVYFFYRLLHIINFRRTKLAVKAAEVSLSPLKANEQKNIAFLEETAKPRMSQPTCWVCRQ